MRFPLIVAAFFGLAVGPLLSIGAGDLSAKVPSKRIARCVKYSQKRGSDDQSVDVGLRNRCRYDVSCTVEWTVSCEDDEADAPARHQARSVDLDRGAREIINASAAVCGDGSWAVDDIRWTCESRDFQ